MEQYILSTAICNYCNYSISQDLDTINMVNFLELMGWGVDEIGEQLLCDECYQKFLEEDNIKYENY